MTEKIIDRIRKMLAIANDLAATEAERDTALNMAYKTMAKYNLDMATIGDKKDAEARERYDFNGFSFPFARSVCNAVADLFFCFYIRGHKINGTQCKHYFIGKESNATTAMVMSDWIVKSIMKEGRKYYKQNTSPECRAFCLGAASKLRQRIDAMIEQAKKVNQDNIPGSALVLASLYDTEHSENESLALATMDFSIKKTRSSQVNLDAYGRGQEFADGINLNLQVGADSKQTLMVK